MATTRVRKSAKIPHKKKRAERPPQGYDSWFEYELHQKQCKGCKFHSHTIKYIQYKTYEPDFVWIDPTGFKIYIEAKGRFRDSGEARKYIDVRNGLSKDEEIVFLFYNPYTPMPRAKKRADGTKLTMAEWATKHKFRYFTRETAPAYWSKKPQEFKLNVDDQ